MDNGKICMRSITPLVVAVLTVLGVAGVAVCQDDAFKPFTGKITSDAVNVRSGPGVNFEVVFQLEQDDLTLVTEQLNEWYKIKLPRGAQAFISRQFIAPSQDNPGLGIITGNRVNVRAAPDTKHNVVGQVDKNQIVEVLTLTPQWVQIFPKEGSAAWVHKDFVDFYGAPDLYLSQEERDSQKFLAQKKSQPSLWDSVPAQTANPPAAPAVKKAVTAAVPAPAVTPGIGENTVVEGKVLELGRFFRRNGTHKLVVGRKTKYYLKSDAVDLDRYIYHSVQLWGTVNATQKSRIPLIEVSKIKNLN